MCRPATVGLALSPPILTDRPEDRSLPIANVVRSRILASKVLYLQKISIALREILVYSRSITPHS